MVLETVSKYAISISLGLFWFVLHTVESSKQNIFQFMAFAVLLLLALSPRITAESRVYTVSSLAVATVISSLAIFAGLISGAGLIEFREGLFTLMVLGLGFLVGVYSQDNRSLLGLGLGSLLLAVFGLFSQWSSTERQILVGSYVGSTGRESPETLTALVGLAVGLCLMGLGKKFGFFAIALTLVNLAVVLRVGLIGGILAAALMLVIFAVARANSSRWSNSWLPRLASNKLVALTVPVLIVLVVSQKPLTLWLATLFRVEDSVRDRYAIWGASWDSASLLGKIIGHGNNFWSEGSVTQFRTAESLSRDGLPVFAHGHSMYVELLLSFGVVGVAIIVGSVSVLLWSAAKASTQQADRDFRLFPWLFAAPSLVFGLGESVLVIFPTGWFITGFTLGMLLKYLLDVNPKQAGNRPEPDSLMQ